ncbi:MAG: class I SAM-dependent methyltransferase [Candidatus Micrarchaeota archaeon]
MSLQTPSLSKSEGFGVPRLSVPPRIGVAAPSDVLRRRHEALCNSNGTSRRLASLVSCSNGGGQELNGNGGISNGGKNGRASKNILFAGLRGITDGLSLRQWSEIKGAMRENLRLVIGIDANIQKVNTVSGLARNVTSVEYRPDIVILGPDIYDNGNCDQEKALQSIISSGHPIKVIYVCPDALSAAEKKKITQNYENVQIMMQSLAGPDFILQKLHSLSEVHESLLSEPSEIVICRFEGDKIERVTFDGMVETMDEFAIGYAMHMKRTLHTKTIDYALSRLEGFVGDNILDAGCGPGTVLGHFMRDVMALDFDEGKRSHTNILSVDVSERMIKQAVARYARYLDYTLLSEDPECPGRDRTLKPLANTTFLQRDFMSLTLQNIVEAGPGFDIPDTILASYFISWVSKDKAAAARKLAEFAKEGTYLITIEEVDQSITPSPHMKPRMKQLIEDNIVPVKSLSLYYQLLTDAGWEPVEGADEPYSIGPVEDQRKREAEGKPPHDLRAKVFVWPG